jgi:hypothetical protein
MITSCEFNPQECHIKCKNFPICSFIHIEKHITELERKLSNIYESINSLTEFCTRLGDNVSLFKEDTIDEFHIIVKDITSLKQSLTRSKET